MEENTKEALKSVSETLRALTETTKVLSNEQLASSYLISRILLHQLSNGHLSIAELEKFRQDASGHGEDFIKALDGILAPFENTFKKR